LQVQDDIITIERKWGYFLQFTRNDPTTVKLLYVNKGSSISYQYHNHRLERWYIVKGRVLVTKGIISYIVPVGNSVTIDIRERHKLEGLEDSIILEISHGYFDENDIIRIENNL
jgi:mannose-6-phosphate isomerase